MNFGYHFVNSMKNAKIALNSEALGKEMMLYSIALFWLLMTIQLTELFLLSGCAKFARSGTYGCGGSRLSGGCQQTK